MQLLVAHLEHAAILLVELAGSMFGNGHKPALLFASGWHTPL